MVLRCERKLFDFFPYRQKKSPTDEVGLFQETGLVLVDNQNCLGERGQIPNAVNGNPRPENDTPSFTGAT